MDYEIQREVDYIVDEVVNFRYSRETGANKVKQAIRSLGRGGENKTVRDAMRYYEQQCDSRNL